MNWPSTPSPWVCRCGAVWTLEGAEEFEDATPPAAGELDHPPRVDMPVLLPRSTSLTDSELETLARTVGAEQRRRLAQAVETERPCLLPTEGATTGPPRSSTDEVEPKAPAKVIPAARVPPRPALVHIAPCGKVWHADASCRHLYIPSRPPTGASTSSRADEVAKRGRTSLHAEIAARRGLTRRRVRGPRGCRRRRNEPERWPRRRAAAAAARGTGVVCAAG